MMKGAILKLRKKDLATWDAIEILANYLKCSPREFGYAGLKDKNAMTVQHISVHRKFEEALKEFSHENIKILETTYHNNKIKIGHLKGNNFFIRLKRVGLVEKQKIEEDNNQYIKDKANEVKDYKLSKTDILDKMHLGKYKDKVKNFVSKLKGLLNI